MKKVFSEPLMDTLLVEGQTLGTINRLKPFITHTAH